MSIQARTIPMGVLIVMVLVTPLLFARCSNEISMAEMRQQKKEMMKGTQDAIALIDDKMQEKVSVDGRKRYYLDERKRNELEAMKKKIEKTQLDLVTVDRKAWPQFSDNLADQLLNVKTAVDTMQVPQIEITAKPEF